MSAAEPDAPTQRRLSKRQRATVHALLDAAVEEIRDFGYDNVTVRSVAKRAGVTHTTAYSYFTSKGHLVSEIHWRQMQALPPPDPPEDASFVERVRLVFAGPAAALAGEPEVARGVLVAILGDDPDIRRVRELVGRAIVERLRTALAPIDDPELVQTLLLAYSGAMVVVGTGSREFTGVVRHLETVARQIDPSR